ncbi:MAG: Ig-like domain-containing protein [bacterium]|nr:Ig-like domain-containing protein [bacterium]
MCYKIPKNMIFVIVVLALIMIPKTVFANNGGSGITTTTPGTSTTPSSNPSTSPSPTPTVATGITIKPDIPITIVEGDTKKFEFSILPDDATNQEVVWTSSDTNVATVSDSGEVTALKAGTTTITVQMKDDTRIKATCLVTVTARTLSSDATLKSLSVKNGTLDKMFQSATFEYTVTVSKGIKELELEYNLNDSKATGAMIANNENIITGTKVKIVVTAEDKTTQTYTLVVKKEEINLNLKSLSIKGYTLNETFKAGKTDYTADIPYEAVDVTVVANAEDSEAEVTVKGDTELKIGKNTVIITVSNEGSSKSYQVIVTRGAEDEVEDKSGNGSKYSSGTANSTSGVATNTVVDRDGSSNIKHNVLRYVFVTIGSFVLFAIGAIGIYFFVKTVPKKEKNAKRGKGAVKKVEQKEVEHVETDKDTKSSENKQLKSIMPGDLEETREFRVDDLNHEKKNAKIAKDIESLFEDD